MDIVWINFNQNFTDLDDKNESYFLGKFLKFLTIVFLLWVKTAVVKEESKIKFGFLSITPSILVLQTKFEYPWNPCKISDQMSPSKAPNSKKKWTHASIFDWFFLKEGATKQEEIVEKRRHLLSEMDNFRAI